jgi:tetratricopeptide (TPR) repeat protein
MREALHHTFNLNFDQALDEIKKIETDGNPTLASQLIRGMIAYFQNRWQTRLAPPSTPSADEILQTILETNQEISLDNPQEQLFVGLATIFTALSQQSKNPLQALQLFNMGQARLQQTLLHYETMTDAHLGLGLVYFSTAAIPSLLQRLLRNSNRPTAENAIHHLQRAAEVGQFSQHVAQTFLLRLYELEKRYKDAIILGQRLQDMFPRNGYYALLTGRSQHANRDYTACVTTLGHLAAQIKMNKMFLASHHDRFDLYYFWGLALNETKRYAESFTALRQAINEDLREQKDETLWAKYYLADLYARQGQTKTARQLYHTLLRGRNVENLHTMIQQRLARLD